ncbi:MAG: GMC oxidoreductase, partial [Bacteroidales bacterium]|nr:GMC oxidoreductase [Bacteroidales bacterium]
YSVLVIEKGKHYNAKDFPKTNWNLRKWLWLPSLRFFGFFKMTFYKHVGVLSGVGVGGGSLVYANTLPKPKTEFFNSGNWAGICDWEKELSAHYSTAETMLGAVKNPKLFDSDNTLGAVAEAFNKENAFEPTKVAVYFGEVEKTVPDPFFNGEGPDRAGCTFCGACMTGCRHNAKNTLDKNYLYLAGKKGAELMAEKEVIRVIPADSADGSGGYFIDYKSSTSFLFKKHERVNTKGVIFAGGVLGTVRLLLNMKSSHLPNLSKHVGNFIRTNNESLVLVTSRQKQKKFSEGVAIGSILQVDQNSHLEPVRYGSGSGFWKLMGVPLVHGKNMFTRFFKLIFTFFSHPLAYLKIYFVRDFASRSVILLYMQNLDSTIRFRRGIFNLKSTMSEGKAPTAFMKEAKDLADKTAEIIEGKPMVLATEALTGIPTTAHILGGAVIGSTAEEGVVDSNQKVFGYENMYVCDGSAVSANPGVNPSLTITAMSERVMGKIKDKV